MSVTRISEDGLKQILNNRVLTPVTCIVKFYSNSCHMCHSLQEYFVTIAEQYELDPNIVFYAYNVELSYQLMINFIYYIEFITELDYI